MSTRVLTVLAILGAAASLAAQTTATPPKPAPKTLTISGCVISDSTGRDRFTLSDGNDGTTYRLSGTSVRQYVGQRVQITGGVESKRLQIAGGLLPSPNIAAQAGAIDPAGAAVAASTAGTGRAPLPTFRVTRVRALTGSCPER
jgi:hypothetical protein